MNELFSGTFGLSRSVRVVALCGSVMLGAMLGGCYSPGGSGHSSDVFCYDSTSWQPWTVSLIDTRTGESVWSVDVPVGKRLILGFREGSGPNRYKPDMMRWGIMEGNRGVGDFQSQIPVPAKTARRLEPTLRAVPEMPHTPTPGSPYEDSSWSLVKSGEVSDGKSGGSGAPKTVTPLPTMPVVPPTPEPKLEPETVKPSEAPPVVPPTPPHEEPATPAPQPVPAPAAEEPKSKPAQPQKPDEPPVDLPGN